MPAGPKPARRRSRRVAMTLGCALAILLGTTSAFAEVRRYALLIGANRGLPHQVPLRYAESDVDAVARTLTAVSGFASERVVRITGATAARARTALVDLNLTIQDDVRRGHEAVLFVYYSGHGDGQTLHLGTSELGAEELGKLVKLSSAKLKVMMLDACRSGAVTRVKGGRQIPPLQIGVDDQLRHEGFAVITSSAAGEDAQESDDLRSSIFTHHFLAALRGAADVNRDSLVTLGEAYAYAYEQSLKTSMGTVAGSQHATFDYDLRGRADPVLADVRSLADQGRVVMSTPGEYLLTAAETDAVLVEAVARAPQTVVAVPAGRYRVRLRTRTNVYQGELTLRAGASTAIGPDQLRPVPLAQVVRKGSTDVRLAHGPLVTGQVHGPLDAGFSPMMGAQLGWALDLPMVTLMPRVGFATGHSNRSSLDIRSHQVQETTFELAGLYVVDVGRVSVAPLVSVGWSLFRQTVERGAGCVDNCRFVTRPHGLVTSVGGWAAVPLGRGFAVELFTELANFYLRRQQSRETLDRDAPRFGTLTYRTGIGVGYRH
jgi:hypothetical protein